MSTIQEDINSGLCTLGELLGTEISKSCISAIKASRSIWAIAPGESFAADQTYESELTRLITNEKLVVLRGVATCTENGSEDASETLEDDTKFITNKGKYAFAATFTNGMYFNKAVGTIEGFKNWNIILVDDNGIWGTKTTNGGLTGFTTGMIQRSKLVIGSNTQGQKEGLMFQFLVREELDDDFAYIPKTTAKKQKGVTQVTLSLTATPSDADTTNSVKAVLAQNESVAFTGIDYLLFLRTIGGVTANPTAGDDSTTEGTFLLTVAAESTGNEGAIRLYDNANNRPVIVGADGDYYKSNTVTYTTVA